MLQDDPYLVYTKMIRENFVVDISLLNGKLINCSTRTQAYFAPKDIF